MRPCVVLEIVNGAWREEVEAGEEQSVGEMRWRVESGIYRDCIG